MKVFWPASIALVLFGSAALAAEPFDGSVPFSCTPQKGHDCLPTEDSCKPLKPESDKAPEFGFDVAKKQVKSPFRTSLLPIQHVTKNKTSLVLQGTNLEFAWSAVINRTTGKMTVTVADREGAYIAFGQCKVATETQ